MTNDLVFKTTFDGTIWAHTLGGKTKKSAGNGHRRFAPTDCAQPYPGSACTHAGPLRFGTRS